MTIMAADIINSVMSHALRTGMFDTVNGHEPKSVPGNGLTAAVWAQQLMPVQMRSGLDRTTVRVELTVRLYMNMLQEPQDAIDPVMVDATDVLMASYSASFTLAGLVANVDLLGAHGTGLMAQAGYQDVSGTMMRVTDITLPLIINDLWVQVA